VKTPAWQRAEGQNKDGGLNATGRASLRAEGKDIKPPVKRDAAAKSPAKAKRRDSQPRRQRGQPQPDEEQARCQQLDQHEQEAHDDPDPWPEGSQRGSLRAPPATWISITRVRSMVASQRRGS
jgi:hypothetical protein